MFFCHGSKTAERRWSIVAWETTGAGQLRAAAGPAHRLCRTRRGPPRVARAVARRSALPMCTRHGLHCAAARLLGALAARPARSRALRPARLAPGAAPRVPSKGWRARERQAFAPTNDFCIYRRPAWKSACSLAFAAQRGGSKMLREAGKRRRDRRAAGRYATGTRA